MGVRRSMVGEFWDLGELATPVAAEAESAGVASTFRDSAMAASSTPDMLMSFDVE